MVLRRLFAVCLLALAGCEAATAVLETVDELQQNSAPSSLTISTDAENEIATARPIGGARFARSTFSFSAIHDRAMTRRWLTSLLRTTSSSCRSLFRRRTPGSFRTVPR
jgi:hypothetical protein